MMNFKFLILSSLFSTCFWVFSVPTNIAAAAETPGTVLDKNAPQITVIPNPARGKKLTFRVMSKNRVIVHLRVTDRFFDPVDKIEQEGEGLFDILWSLQKVSDGMYYYQAQIEDKNSGQVTPIPLQRFIVMRDVPTPKKKASSKNKKKKVAVPVTKKTPTAIPTPAQN